jgi:hypothetical protein
VADRCTHRPSAREVAREDVRGRRADCGFLLDLERVAGDERSVTPEQRQVGLDALEPDVDLVQRATQPLHRVRDGRPRLDLRERVQLGPVACARGVERALVGEVGVDGVSLDAGALRDRGDRRP